MFAIVTCPGCRNDRMLDLSTGTTSCPFCGKRVDTDRLHVKFKHADQSVVREVLHGSESVPMKDDGSSPEKKLAYSVSHCNNPGEKMYMIAEGLMEIYGEITVEMIERLVPGKGEKMAAAMLDACIIYETGYGRFRTV